jgi:hypothetical protein
MLSSTYSSEVTFTEDEDVISYFTEKWCNALAWELHKLTGWSLVIVSDLPLKDDNYGGHAFLMDSDGLAVDIMGRRNLGLLQDYWDFCPFITRFHTAEDYQREIERSWDNAGSYMRNRKAKMWAKSIVDLLNEF